MSATAEQPTISVSPTPLQTPITFSLVMADLHSVRKLITDLDSIPTPVIRLSSTSAADPADSSPLDSLLTTLLKTSERTSKSLTTSHTSREDLLLSKWTISNREFREELRLEREATRSERLKSRKIEDALSPSSYDKTRN